VVKFKQPLELPEVEPNSDGAIKGVVVTLVEQPV
jgi:hypothetical protein